MKKAMRNLLRHYGYDLKKIGTTSNGAPTSGKRANPYLSLSNWSYQEPVVSGHIQPADLVLDIGSGHAPAARADILADYFVDDTFHRAGRVVDDRPFVACTVERLPFQQKSIDFVICSHILEHVDSPVSAGRELAKIARAGYVETPAYGKDILVGTGNMHRWQVVEFEGVMHFFEYSERQREAHVTSPMMDLWMSREHHPWQDFFWERQDLFNAMHVWVDQPSIIEHRRTQQIAPMLPAWQPIDTRLIPDVPCLLSDTEIELLEKCLATPDGLEPMMFAQDHFRNHQGDVCYPVRGKRVYCEMATGDA